MANILFLIIDMQNGFINNFTEDLIPKILDFQAKIGDSVLTAGTCILRVNRSSFTDK